jgi:phosphoribosylanthranilate isomerase
MTAMWIKVCGMTTTDAVQAALDARVDAIGFVFAESKRRVTPAEAVKLAQPARGRVRCIAVTKHPSQAEVDEILNVFQPDVLQSDWEDLRSLNLPRELTVLPVLRSGRNEPTPLPARVLFEGPVSGTGLPTDWKNAYAVARRTELILAGGLSPANVAQAIAEVQPRGVDVSSGVEQSPGLKSPEKIASFVQAARAAAQAATQPTPSARGIVDAAGSAQSPRPPARAKENLS